MFDFIIVSHSDRKLIFKLFIYVALTKSEYDVLFNVQLLPDARVVLSVYIGDLNLIQC